MNFEKALELLKQGKKVRRKIWPSSDIYITFSDDDERLKLIDNEGKFQDIYYKLSKYDSLANDWEEYKEPLLTEEEKEYLRMIIKFTPGNIKIVILGRHFVGCNYIYLHYSNDDMINSYSHCVSKGLFKNLEGYKSYTLEELGLDEV